MRIVGGTLSGRRFSGPPGKSTRPTSERVREGIASALISRGWIDGAQVLDLYAGTGALAFEMLSRGAEAAVLIEKSRPVAKAIARSAQELGLGSRALVVQADLERAATSWLSRIPRPADLVLLDPPYADIAHAQSVLSSLAEHGKLADGAAVVVEFRKRCPPVLPLGFDEVSSYRYGDTAVLLATFTRDEAQP